MGKIALDWDFHYNCIYKHIYILTSFPPFSQAKVGSNKRRVLIGAFRGDGNERLVCPYMYRLCL